MTMLGLIAICAAAALVPAAATSAEKPEDRAQVAAESWLKLVDEGRYEISWEKAAALFRAAVTREQWNQVAARVRTPLGKVLSRKLKSRQRTQQVPGAPDGDYVVLQYDTTFEHKKAAVETVTPMLDKGTWRVSGYFVR